jgi:putative membrane protein
MGWWMIFGGVFWVCVIVLIVWGVKKLSERSGVNGGSNALDIARERYARGEISHEEFEKIKKNLS